jgi:hypothetical protein
MQRLGTNAADSGLCHVNAVNSEYCAQAAAAANRLAVATALALLLLCQLPLAFAVQASNSCPGFKFITIESDNPQIDSPDLVVPDFLFDAGIQQRQDRSHGVHLDSTFAAGVTALPFTNIRAPPQAC